MNGCIHHGTKYLKTEGNATYCGYIMEDGFMCLYHPHGRYKVHRGEYKCKYCGKPGNPICKEHFNIYQSLYRKVRKKQITKDEMKEELRKLAGKYEAAAFSLT